MQKSLHNARMCGQINFWKEINTFIKQECIKLIVNTVKTLIMLQKIFISNKCCSFELYQRNLKKSITVYSKILSLSIAFNIDNNNKSFLSNKFRVISEASCDTGVMMLKIQL